MISGHEDIIKILEGDLARYDMVYLIRGDINLTLIWDIIYRKAGRYMFYIPSHRWNKEEVKHVADYRMLTENEENTIMELYRLYEFADNFRLLINDAKNYGCLMDFVRTGVLTEYEAYSIIIG